MLEHHVDHLLVGRQSCDFCDFCDFCEINQTQAEINQTQAEISQTQPGRFAACQSKAFKKNPWPLRGKSIKESIKESIKSYLAL